MATLGDHGMFLPTPYGGNSTEWVNSVTRVIYLSSDTPSQKVLALLAP